MPLTEQAFRAWIDEAERHDRFTNYTTYDNYWLGNYDSINFAAEISAALSVDIAIRANMCSPIINSKVQYILGDAPVNIKATGSDIPDEQLKGAERWITSVYKTNNLLFNNMLKLIRGMSIRGDGFVKISLPAAGGANDLSDKLKIRVINPRKVFPKYRSDDYEEMELCAVKSFDYDEAGNPKWKAQVWYPDVLELWELDSADQTHDQDTTDHEWWRVDTLPNELGFIPVVHFPNIINDQQFGISDLHNVTTLQCALLKYLTDEAITADYQAYKRLFITGAMTVPGKQWRIDPGTITEIPDPDAKITEIDAGDLSGFLAVVDQTIDLMCIVTQTPRIALSKQTGGVPSGYALEIEYLPLKSKTTETVAVLKAGFQQINEMLLKTAIKAGLPFGGIDCEINFVGGLPGDKTTMVANHEKQITNRTLSRETAMQEEGIADIENEKEKIDAEDFSANPARRLSAETSSIRKRIESGGALTTTPRPEAVSPAERARAKQPPPIK